MDVLEHLLRVDPPREPIGSIADCFVRLAACPFDRPIERALWGGFQADRLGYAFVAGYAAALDRLLAGAGVARGPRRLSLAATESGGAHPRAIATRLTNEPDGSFVLVGEKTFATLASVADEMIVVASTGTDADGTNRLRLVRVATGAPGVAIEERAPTPFAPEIPHARVKLSSVAVRAEDVLPGDGYAAYLKPFRTIEDTHVLAAALGHVIRSARLYRFDTKLAEGAAAFAAAVRRIAEMEADDPVAHVALAGILRAARGLIAEHDGEWEKADAETRDRWRRDLALLAVADTVREKRTEAAWRTLGARAA